MKLPKVNIILVNYNGYEDTIECISSLLQLEYSNFQIILIDNGSNDSYRLKRENFIIENCIYIPLKENDGFSAGNNVGIKYAMENGAEYILLLNNDTVVDNNLLSELLAPFTIKKVGMTTGDIYYYKKKEKWYSNGLYDRDTCITKMIVQRDDDVNEVSFICGCCMMLSRKMIEDIGLLDERFFLYSEDTDYCCKAIDAGWKLMSNQKAKVYHKVSASAKSNSDFQNYYLVRNNWFMIKKYGTRKKYAFAKRILEELKQVIKGREHLKVFISAVYDANRGLMGKTNKY